MELLGVICGKNVWLHCKRYLLLSGVVKSFVFGVSLVMVKWLWYIYDVSYIRQFKTASGATGVQVCYKKGREVVKTVHIGSASDEASLLRLLKKAREVMDEGKCSLFDLSDFDA